MLSYDVIVVGLGGMGSAACYELARRGHRVLGLDRHHPPHALGGTHGRSRIIRQAYMEAPEYVPLLLAAYEGWARLEEGTGADLLRITGGLMLGAPDSEAVGGSLRSAREHGLPHELLDAAEIRRRFRPFEVDDSMMGLYETRAGVLDPEKSVATFLAEAARHGAEIRTGEAVTGWQAGADRVTVTVESGAWEAARLVLTPGPWAAGLIPGLAVELVPSREVMHWFEPLGGTAAFAPDRFPIYIWEPVEGDVFYGFPALDGEDGGVKAAIHHGGGPASPETVDREVREADIERMRAALKGRIPRLEGRHLTGAVCLYTNSPDHHFLLGPHPDHSEVVLAAGLSGHGFKFAPVIGELLADLALDGRTAHRIDPFRPDRPLPRAAR